MDYKTDIEPVRITARDAYKKSYGKDETYLTSLRDVYQRIRDCVNNGDTHITCHFQIHRVAERIFNELTVQGYNTSLRYDQLNNVILGIDWKEVDLDPDKKYILPLDDTANELGDVCAYAFKHEDKWCIDYCLKKSAPEVTAKDLEEAPEWVKWLEPEEVDD